MPFDEAFLTRREFSRGALGAGAALACGPTFAPAAQDAPPRLLAGAAETVVTPDAEGTLLIGPLKPSTGVHDDLFARALVLSDGTTDAALVTLDYLGFDFAFHEVLAAAVASASGIPAERTMIACSHTHSAPVTAPWGPWERKKDRSFHAFLPERLGRLVKEARERLRPARLTVRREPTQIGFNRRSRAGDRIVMGPNPQGTVLPWVDVLALDGTDGRPLAVLFSHAAHPVVVHAASTLLSADFPGFAVRTVRDARPDAVCLFAQGCCGNINAFPLQGGLDAAKAVGRDLGQAVLRGLDVPTDPLEPRRLRVVSHEVALPLQAPPPVESLRESLAKEKNPERRQRWSDLIDLAEHPRPRTMRFPVRIVAWGRDLAVVGLAHDVFAEHHRYVEEVSPFRRTLVFAYTNGLECYVGTRADYLLGEKGGYETSPRGAAFLFDSRLPLAPESEALVRTALRQALDRAAEA